MRENSKPVKNTQCQVFHNIRKMNKNKILKAKDIKPGMKVEVLSGFYYEWQYYLVTDERIDFFREKAKHKQVREF